MSGRNRVKQKTSLLVSLIGILLMAALVATGLYFLAPEAVEVSPSPAPSPVISGTSEVPKAPQTQEPTEGPIPPSRARELWDIAGKAQLTLVDDDRMLLVGANKASVYSRDLLEPIWEADSAKGWAAADAEAGIVLVSGAQSFSIFELGDGEPIHQLFLHYEGTPVLCGEWVLWMGAEESMLIEANNSGRSKDLPVIPADVWEGIPECWVIGNGLALGTAGGRIDYLIEDGQLREFVGFDLRGVPVGEEELAELGAQAIGEPLFPSGVWEMADRVFAEGYLAEESPTTVMIAVDEQGILREARFIDGFVWEVGKRRAAFSAEGGMLLWDPITHEEHWLEPEREPLDGGFLDSGEFCLVIPEEEVFGEYDLLPASTVPCYDEEFQLTRTISFSSAEVMFSKGVLAIYDPTEDKTSFYW